MGRRVTGLKLPEATANNGQLWFEASWSTRMSGRFL